MESGEPPVAITTELVTSLVSSQFPQFAHLAVRPVEFDGWDNRTFHLGSELSVRLPSADGYVLQVEKESRWLPTLAAHLPLPVPVPVGRGHRSPEFPRPWSINRWLPGETAFRAPISDRVEFARTLAAFLRALQEVDASDGPPPGPHNFYRGAPVEIYADETAAALVRLRGVLDVPGATSVWEAATASVWSSAPVWFHGDIAPGNLLVQDGSLSAVIDFGTCGVGDPACDLVIAWTFFDGESRAAFRAGIDLDDATWARARGWALWKALISVPDPADGRAKHGDATNREQNLTLIQTLIDDHAARA